ncbi:MAG: hypothetical protein A2068_14665 [Ignavibacteria bacterium GWB2_35_6b]|nr:MAG: hypothetical protein A2068_14665 [Ignavibacteria bacterium GWB2_35_6b]
MEDTIHNKKRTPLKIAAWVVGGVMLAIIFALVFGYFVMLLWNWLMPEIFGLPELTYWQAAGVIILARLLFGGMGHHNHDKHKKFKRKFNCSDEFKKEAEDWKYYHEYWKDEGEEAFKEYLRKKKEGNND